MIQTSKIVKTEQMKKICTIGLVCLMTMAVLTGCGSDNSNSSGGTTAQSGSAVNFDNSKDIVVVSREDGSGTRGAFVELTKVAEKDGTGNTKDRTSKEAIIVNNTNIMLTTVVGNEYAVGYISLGSLNEQVKAVDINGIQATAENVKNGTYTLARPFNIATKGTPSPLAQDFIDYILSGDGQAVVSRSYIAIADQASAYAGSKPSGKLVIAGSSSVSPIMEKLIEAYKGVNPNCEIELQTNDSTSGINGAISGVCDIGMASRDLKDSEKAELTSTAIALDGIAVIVNNDNPLTNMTMETVENIFTGTQTTWESSK